MSTELAKSEERKLATFGSMMDETAVSGQDILMPTLLLMQPMSTFVMEEKAKTGEWRGSLNGELLAGKADTVEIIPFGFHKTWVVFKKSSDPRKNKPEFVTVEPYSFRPTRSREEVINGVSFQNFETINYFAMLAKDIFAPTTIPYLLRLRSTAFITGKKMETMRAQLHKAKKPHCFSTFKLGSVYKENEQGKFYVPTIDWGRDTTEEELEIVKPWLELARDGKAKVDDSDLRGQATDDDAPVVEVDAKGAPGFEC